MSNNDFVVLEVPLLVEGQEIVLVEDELYVSDNLHEYTECVTTDGRYTLYVQEEMLIKVQQSYPLAKVYGLFQFLYENGRISERHPINIFYRNRENNAGIWFQGDDDFTSEGAYKFTSKGNFVRGRIVGASVKDSDQVAVDQSEEGLILPNTHLMTSDERTILIKQEKQRQVIQVCVVSVIVMLIAFGGNLFLQFQHDAKLNEIEAMRTELQSIRDDILFLQKSRIGKFPDIGDKIDFIGMAYIQSGEMTTVSTVDNSKYIPPNFQAGIYVVTANDNERALSAAFHGKEIKMTNLPGNRLRIDYMGELIR